MIRREIRTIQGEKGPKKFCEVVVKDGEAILENKVRKRNGDTVYEKIPWEDMKYQVEKALSAAKR